jgi:hypothetical protein
MISKTDFTIGNIEAACGQDAQSHLDKLMEELGSGRMAARIIEAARLACAGQIYQMAQESPTVTESENSAV